MRDFILCWVVWVILGVAFSIWDMEHQFRWNNGKATPSPRFWWHWPICAGYIVALMVFILVADFVSGVIFFFTGVDLEL